MTGKYHPSADVIKGCFDETGELVEVGGLVHHTIAVTGIAHSLMRSNVFRDMLPSAWIAWTDCDLSIYGDIVIASCLLHDIGKVAKDKIDGSNFGHPIISARWFQKVVDTNYKDYEDRNYDIVGTIRGCIACHMGKWTTSDHSNIVLPVPYDAITNYVHMCDYLASRKFIDFNFDKYYEDDEG